MGCGVTNVHQNPTGWGGWRKKAVLSKTISGSLPESIKEMNPQTQKIQFLSQEIKDFTRNHKENEE